MTLIFLAALQIQRLSRVDSDFVSFLQHAGIPSIDMYYGKGTHEVLALGTKSVDHLHLACIAF